MKDKELREIVYNACEEFDKKLNFIYEQLEQLERYGAIDIPKNTFLTPINPFESGRWFNDLKPNWKNDLKKTKCKVEY